MMPVLPLLPMHAVIGSNARANADAHDVVALSDTFKVVAYVVDDDVDTETKRLIGARHLVGTNVELLLLLVVMHVMLMMM